MDELPTYTVDLIAALDKEFQEETASDLLIRSKKGTLHEYLGKREVIEFLKRLQDREENDTEV